MELSPLDIRILNILQDDSTLSYRQVAKKAKASAVTVMKHIHKMEKEKIIKKYGALVDYEKLGYEVSVIVDIRISKGKLFQLEKKIASHPNVFAVYDNTGAFDVTAIAKFRSRSSMDKFLKTLQSWEFVERTETKLILNTIKEEGMAVG
ncbi:AsnC family transcriptional regulator [Candidatus Micrarchaeota archaeon CG10_big_fil_rev_8_21_14_0_10_45_29]|nr:MAG: AsnC family transcriptional regulator [Candidatus Micrarchaeota archaeon CG10_big_fil_rev_8_21_14_0_10_45_29]